MYFNIDTLLSNNCLKKAYLNMNIFYIICNHNLQNFFDAIPENVLNILC